MVLVLCLTGIGAILVLVGRLGLWSVHRTMARHGGGGPEDHGYDYQAWETKARQTAGGFFVSGGLFLAAAAISLVVVIVA